MQKEDDRKKDPAPKIVEVRRAPSSGGRGRDRERGERGSRSGDRGERGDRGDRGERGNDRGAFCNAFLSPRSGMILHSR